MFVSSVGVNKVNNSKTMKIGRAAGLGAGAAYLLKNKEDIFIQRAKESMAKYGTKKFGVISSAIVAAGTLFATTAIGAGIGNAVGKLVEGVKQKKQLENLKQALADKLNSEEEIKKRENVTPVSINELTALLDE